MTQGAPSQSSAVSRCPPEIWRKILHHAVSFPASRYHDDLFEPVQCIEDVMQDPSEVAYDKREEGIAMALDIALVCHAWKRVVDPLLVDWIIVPGTFELLDTQFILREPIDDLSKGWFVRRLEVQVEVPSANPGVFAGLHTGDMDEETWIASAVLGLISVCPHLQELICDSYVGLELAPLVKCLFSACSETLESLALPSYYQPYLRDVTTLLSKCSRLKALRFQHPYADEPPLNAPTFEHDPLHEPLAIERLAWTMSNEISDIHFVDFMTDLKLPHLRRVDITFDIPADEEDTDNPVLGALTRVLQAHGRDIETLVIDGVVDLDNLLEDRTIATFLEYCPCLVECAVDILAQQYSAPATPHRAIRRIRCDQFFASAETFTSGSPALELHVNLLLSNIAMFCSPSFPKLEVIRFLDIQPSSPAMEAVKSERGDFPDEYRVLAEKIQVLCGARNIRFENCLGDLVRPDFGPLNYWPDSEDEGEEEEEEEDYDGDPDDIDEEADEGGNSDDWMTDDAKSSDEIASVDQASLSYQQAAAIADLIPSSDVPTGPPAERAV